MSLEAQRRLMTSVLAYERISKATPAGHEGYSVRNSSSISAHFCISSTRSGQ